MRSAITLIHAATILAIAGCATPSAVGTETIDASYVTGGGTWDSGGGISVVARAYERDGVAVVCGAWASDGEYGEAVGYSSWVIEAGAVDLAGDRLVQNLSYMRNLPYAENLSGQQANCATAGKPWQPEYASAEAVVRFPRMAFATDDIVTANTVVFRPGPRADIAR